jgi:hypothetical protein
VSAFAFVEQTGIDALEISGGLGVFATAISSDTEFVETIGFAYRLAILGIVNLREQLAGFDAEVSMIGIDTAGKFLGANQFPGAQFPPSLLEQTLTFILVGNLSHRGPLTETLKFGELLIGL